MTTGDKPELATIPRSHSKDRRRRSYVKQYVIPQQTQEELEQEKYEQRLIKSLSLIVLILLFFIATSFFVLLFIFLHLYFSLFSLVRHNDDWNVTNSSTTTTMGPNARSVQEEVLALEFWSMEPYNTLRTVCHILLCILLGLICFYTLGIPFAFRALTCLHYHAFFAHRCGSRMNSSKRTHPIGVRNFWIQQNQTHPLGKLGAWFLPPDADELSPCPNPSSPTAEDFAQTNVLVLYLHGAGGTREWASRVALYRRLSGIGAHLLTFDYRGFADSTRISPPTASTMTSDVWCVYRWLVDEMHVSPTRILLWGHSLGAAILVRLLAEGKTACLGAVLEAPFTNMEELIAAQSFTRYFSCLPWFEHCFVAPFVENPDLAFDSLTLMDQVPEDCPLLLLHAAEDSQVPSDHSEQLFARAPSNSATTFYLFEAAHRCGHCWIAKADELAQIVVDFVEDARAAFVTTHQSSEANSVN